MTLTRIVVLAMLATVGAALSGVLMLEHYGLGAGETVVQELCGDSAAAAESGCEQVSESRYSSIGGISLGGIGLFFYASVLLLVCLALAVEASTRESLSAILFCSLGAALVIDTFLFAIQAFAIGAFCRLCIGTYMVNLAAGIVLWPALKKLSSLPEAVRAPGTRSALLAWAAGSFVILVTMVATERVFAVEETRREAHLLGTDSAAVEPAPAPVATTEAPLVVAAAPAPVTDGDDGETPVAGRMVALENEVRTARAEIERLQQTLDDPQKYQEYQQEKATREFEAETEKQLALDGIPFKGPESAPIRVVAFSDFLCPYCRSLAGALSNFLPQSAGRIAIYYKNYPLDQDCNPSLSRTIHPGACELALGAVCAHEQGKFWNLHDRIFQNPPTNPNLELVVQMAREVGLDGDALRTCMGSSKAKERLTADIEEAKRLEVASTPTVFINGRHLAQINGFLTAINSEAERLGLPSSQE